MTFLCFVLDLRSLLTWTLKDLKQKLLQLANLYAVSSSRSGDASRAFDDCMALCYIHRNGCSGVDELEIVHNPQRQFGLRDFHHAVNSLPDDCFLSNIDPLVTREVEGPPSERAEISQIGLLTVSLLLKLLHSEYLYSWGGETALKKVFVISSSLVENIAPSKEMLMDAADNRVTFEFILIEEHPIDLCNQASRKIKGFLECISHLENCTLKKFPCNGRMLSGLVKSWLQDLNGDNEDPLHAIFYFKNNLIGSVDYISCNLFVSAIQMLDGFVPCQSCMCHGLPINTNRSKPNMSCPATNRELSELELIETGVMVGEHTVLHLPSFHSYSEPQRIHGGPISFNVIERTNLSSLNEGAIVGTSFVVVPQGGIGSSSAERNKQELNTQLFYGICGALHCLDQGLLCVSTCNTETMKESIFNRFYLLQPSEKGPMLLRRLAGSEEIMTPCIMDLAPSSSVMVEIERSIQDNLLKMDSRDYNPLHRELGLHTKLNALVKESLQFGAITSNQSKPSSFTCPQQHHQANTMSLDSGSGEERVGFTQPTEEEKEVHCIEDEWVSLIVKELDGNLSSPGSHLSREKRGKWDGEKPAVDKTSSILERLEPPRSKRLRATTSLAGEGEYSCGVVKQMTQPAMKPLIPFEQDGKGSVVSLSQPLKPNFQRFKRKLK